MQFLDDLNTRLAAIRAEGLHRELRRIESPQGRSVVLDGRSLLNFSSNDYLGLANHPLLKEAAIRALHDYGAGSGASRLICGSIAAHHQLEETLAAFKGTDAALTFSSGYATAVGAITALLGKDDVIILDKLVHASIVDAARLSGARLRVFTHNDLDDLEDILKWADSRAAGGTDGKRARTLVVTETVFSMDGDIAPLRDIVRLKDQYGAWLMVDEAHGTGLYGANRRGVAEEQGVSDRIEIQMGTLGKAIGSAGGYIAGPRQLIEFLVNRARSFIFSTAPPPSQSAAARAGIELIQSPEGQDRCSALWTLVQAFKARLQGGNLNLPESCSAILPIIIGAETEAVARSQRLREAGLLVPAIRYPTVARGSARLRVTLTAAHSAEDIKTLTHALQAP